MKLIRCISLVLCIIGSLNWGLIGLFNFNLVTFLFQVNSGITRFIYILIGLSAILSLSYFFHEDHM